MKNIINSISAKFVVVAVVLLVVLGSVVPANAQQVTVTTTASAPVFARDLTVGSTGNDVAALQAWLVQRGFLTMPNGVAMGYFGPLTKAAVRAYQATVGLPTTGYFGPLTRAKIAAGAGTTVVVTVPGCLPGALYSTTTGARCDVTTTTVPGCVAGALYSMTTGARCDGSSSNNNNNNNTNTGPLRGDAGTIADVTELSQYNNEEVGEGEDDVRVLGFEVEAEEGDIRLNSVRVSFDSTGNTGSDDLDDYIESIAIFQGDRQVGEADAEDFNDDDNVFSRTITLNNAIVREDQTERFYVVITASSNLDSDDISGDSWTVDIDNIRYEDASGVVTTDDDAGDIGSMDVPFNFVSFSESADTELQVRTTSDTPEEGVIIVAGDTEEDDVVLIRGEIEVEGDSDITLDELPVTLTATGVSDIDLIVSNLTLTINGEEYHESVSTSGASEVITFDDLDLTLEAGETVDFSITADINEFSGAFGEGDTIRAQITATNWDNIDAENEEDDQVADSDTTGTALGETLELRSEGPLLTHVSSNTSVAAGTGASDDQGTFTIRFKVRAEGDTLYVSSLADVTSSGVTDGKTSVGVERAGTAVTSGVSVVLSNLTDSDLTSVGNYVIEEGEEETFELTTTVQLPTAGSAGLYRALLRGISWGTSDIYPLPNEFTSNLDEFRTSYIGLN